MKNISPQQQEVISKDSFRSRDQSAVSVSVEQQVSAVEASASEVLSGMEGYEIREQKETLSENNSDSHKTPARQQKQNDHQSVQQTLAQQGSRSAKTPAPQEKTVLIRKVKTAAIVELKRVEKDIRKFRRDAKKFAFQLAEAFQKFRNLRNILQNILKFSVEVLQQLFTKIVKKESLATVKI